MVVIVPCAGESTRFKGLKKQFLTHPFGLPLPLYSCTGLDCSEPLEFKFVFIQDEFLERFGSIDAFKAIGTKIGMDVDVILIDKQTDSVVKTVVLALSFLEHRNGFYVKDCDNYFEADIEANSVATMNMYDANCEVRNKSFSRGNPITEIKERAVISPNMNVGGYGFADLDLFLTSCRGSTSLSEVIQQMINMSSVKFYQTPASRYEDYGTLEAWTAYLKKFNENE